MQKRLVLALFFTVIFSGCAGHGASNGPSPSESISTSWTSSSTGSSSEQTSTNEPVQPLPIELRMNDCRGIATLYEWAGNTAPDGPEVPPGWKQDNPPYTDHHTLILECGRVSVGPFERGPVRFLLETHTKANVPAACLDFGEGDQGSEIMRTIWFDDEELVAYFATNWTMPVHFGVFDYQETDAGSVSVRKWTWGERDGPVSELDYSRSETAEGGAPFADRFFWYDGKSVSMMDWKEDTNQPLVTPYQTTGWFRAPMMQADAGVEAYAGVSALVDPGGSYVGTFQRFGDLECKDPLP